MHRSLDPPPTPPPGIGYQPALDGLRGIAVLAVLAYHASLPPARGGFLGVDLFFVLSGYLITAILVAEWVATGGIDLRRFWARRARRLLPALLLVLAAVAVYAALVADPAEQARLRADGLATLAYVANWQQVLAQVSYFEQFTQPSLLKHAWSLGIEEQFYLVWPLLLLGALALLARARLARGRGPLPPAATARRLGWLLVATVAAALGSAALMARLHVPGADPSRVYYGTDTRAQALLAGAALAILAAWRGARGPDPGADRRPDPSTDPWAPPTPRVGWVTPEEPEEPEEPEAVEARRSERPPIWRWVRRAAAVLVAASGPGALAVLVALMAAVRDRDDRMYRGGLLLVAVAAVLVIAAAVRDGGPVRRVLSLAPLRLVGVVSYGLYLWHWPVYSFLTPDRTGWSGGTLLAARLWVTFVAALGSYVLLERPIRGGPVLAGRGLATATGAITATACLLVLATTGGRAALPGSALAAGSDADLPGAGVPLNDPGAVVGPGSRAVASVARRDGTGDVGGDAPGKGKGSNGKEIRVFLAGDSVAFTLAFNLSRQTQAAAGMRVIDAAELGCGVARAANFVDGQPEAQAPACQRWPELWRERLIGARAEVAVVVLGAWEVYDKYDQGRVLEVGTPAYDAYLQQELDFALGTLTTQGVRTVLFTNVPCFKVPDTRLASEADARNDPARGAWVNQVLGRFASRHPGVVSVLDLRGLLCRGPGGDRYLERIDGVVVRGEGVHFTPAGAELVWDWLVPRIEAAVEASAGGGRGDRAEGGQTR